MIDFAVPPYRAEEVLRSKYDSPTTAPPLMLSTPMSQSIHQSNIHVLISLAQNQNIYLQVFIVNYTQHMIMFTCLRIYACIISVVSSFFQSDTSKHSAYA